jgi:hypothetical protein
MFNDIQLELFNRLMKCECSYNTAVNIIKSFYDDDNEDQQVEQDIVRVEEYVERVEELYEMGITSTYLKGKGCRIHAFLILSRQEFMLAKILLMNVFSRNSILSLKNICRLIYSNLLNVTIISQISDIYNRTGQDINDITESIIQQN